jgi:hypothetical protein
MNKYYDWKDVLSMKGLREAVLAYATSNALEYLQDGPGGTKVMSDDVYPYLLERAIKEKGGRVFYFSSGADVQVEDHVHYRFAGKYFECDGAGQIGGPYSDNHAELFLDLAADAYRTGGLASPDLGSMVSVGGDFPDGYFINFCAEIVPVGRRIEINGTLYTRTAEAFVPQV